MKSRRMKWAGYVTRIGKRRNACGILVGKAEEKKPLRRPRHRWVDNMKMDLREIGWVDMDCTGLAQERGKRRALVNMVMNLRLP
jgi:hypothetical protein